jgi:hypothetical protein
MQAIRDEFENFNKPSLMDKLSKPHSTKNLIKENIMIDIHRNEIKPEKIINGYKYGGKYIPFSGMPNYNIYKDYHLITIE